MTVWIKLWCVSGLHSGSKTAVLEQVEYADIMCHAGFCACYFSELENWKKKNLVFMLISWFE